MTPSTSPTSHDTEGQHVELLAQFRLRVANVVDPEVPEFGEIVDSACLAAVGAAIRTRRLPAGRPRIRVLRRGEHDADFVGLPAEVYSVLEVKLRVRCAHPHQRAGS